ncbi:DUF6994 family protein [Weissella cibaria]|uniref:DUF6994 family protein n=1 Tax=Weissella cibaria TaxID=137591 RepID=UPI00215A5D39|nr:hypothetical protein [Weissella cibaria]MCR8702163.1 hypothetical protein [Weissella cibaria]
MTIGDNAEKNKLTLNEFRSFSEEKAVKYDFLKQGAEPDRSELTNTIYEEIFPWYDSKKHAGDTLSTYRTAIRKYYGKHYPSLDRAQQLEIISIIKRYTEHDGDMLFEEQYVSNEGNDCYRLLNNYQLGNFGIFPTQDGINPKRAKAPYLDFFDDFLVVLYQFYEEDDFSPDYELTKAIQAQKNYFDNFDGFWDYVEKNFLQDFFTEDDKSYSFIDLSGSDTFDEYVERATSIINYRGRRIFSVLSKNE